MFYVIKETHTLYYFVVNVILLTVCVRFVDYYEKHSVNTSMT